MVSIDVPDRTGNYGPEAAPAGGESCMIQTGFDQPPATLLVPEQIIGGSAPFPRTDPATTPLAVFFPSVTRGNVVEVFWAGTIGNPGGDGNVTEAQFVGVVAVSFADTPTFPDDFFLVANSQAGTRIPPPVGPLQSDSTFFSMSTCAAFTIPDGDGDTVPCTVWLLYTASQAVVAGGVNRAGFIPGTSVVLKATEYRAECVTQPGPFELVPLGGDGG
jgi:hypothetical protein